MLVSDHGSCSIKQEVFYNRWLADLGYLKYEQVPAKSLEQMHPDSLAYALDPGRIYLNLRDRERDGRVLPGAEYERPRGGLVAAAEALGLPGDGEEARPVLKAFRREEVYSGPYVAQAADIILAPKDGYDPKGAFHKEALLHKDAALNGMHTYDDALCYVSRRGLARERAAILDVTPTILSALGQPVPAECDGLSLL